MASIQGIYLAFFGRPADPLGLAYWEEQTNGGADLSVMLNALSGTEEYQARFVNMSNAEVIESIYQALFGREPEAEGLAHFLEALANGTQTLGSIAVNILDGAQGTDLAIIENKVAAAEAFTASLDTPEEIAAYSGDAAADFGRAFINQVTEDPETIPTAEQVQEQINTDLPDYVPDEAPAPGGGGGGSTGSGSTTPTTPQNIELTVGADVRSGGTAADTFHAKAPGSLNSSDILNGGAERDTLIIEAGARADDIDKILEGKHKGVAPTLNSIEVINNYDKSGVLDLAKSSGLKEVWTHFEESNASHYYMNADENVIFGLTGPGSGKTEHTLSLRFYDHTNIDTLNFALKNAEGYKVFAPGEGTKANKVILSLDNEDATSVSIRRVEVEDIEIKGKGDIYYHYTSGSNFKTFDASDLDGNVNFSFSAHTTNTVVTTGNGDDTIIGGSGNDTINGGAGNDIIWGDKPTNTASDPSLYGDDIINGGAGTNVIVLGTKAQDIKLGGQDTVIHNAEDVGTDIVFNFNFGPVEREDEIGGGKDNVFDILKASGTISEIWLGNYNTVYQGVVGSPSGNIIKLAGNDIYTGGPNDFELVIKFTSGSEIVLANSFSRYEKAKLLKAVGHENWQEWTDETAPDADKVNIDLNSLYTGKGDFTEGLVQLDAGHVADLIGHLKIQGNLELIA